MLWDLPMLGPDPIAIEENMPKLPCLVLIDITWISIQWVNMTTKAFLQAYKSPNAGLLKQLVIEVDIIWIPIVYTALCSRFSVHGLIDHQAIEPCNTCL